LPQGVFLFLGYSETDEALLKPHSNLSIQDAVGSLQDFMRHEFSNKVQNFPAGYFQKQSPYTAKYDGV
jgi:hypothetical protein